MTDQPKTVCLVDGRLMTYHEYLQSDHWRKTRERIRRRARGWCERCKVDRRSDIHHLSYANIGNESPKDLIAVCSECHKYLHGKRRIDPASFGYTSNEIKTIRDCRWYYENQCLSIIFSRHPEYITVWEEYRKNLRKT